MNEYLIDRIFDGHFEVFLKVVDGRPVALVPKVWIRA
jgi:hypothetical protein